MQESIQILMSGYVNGDLTPDELQELENHLESNPADRKIVEDYRLLWEESGQEMVAIPIDVESALIKTKRRIFFRKSNLFQFLQHAAAVLILAGLFSTGYIYYHNSGSQPVPDEQPAVVQEISAIFGAHTKFQLSDGTTVCLNSGSKLIFPAEFKGNSRKVELVGEAYFEVTPNPSKPFIVKTRAINVKVLGTAFNLQAYPQSDEITTTLIHGKVVLERELAGISNQLAELKPSERAVYKTNEKTINISSEDDLEKFTAWKDGQLVFFNDPIAEVAKKLENWYNVTVKISNTKLSQFRFTATFTDEPIEQVLELMSKSSSISYQIKKATRRADNSFSKREIIFY